MHSSPNERPDYLYQSDRRPDQEFDDDEELYFRIPPNPEYWREGTPNLTAIRFPDTSVNRQKYSNCEDVLYPSEGSNDDYCDFGIGSVTVADIPPPPRIVSGDGREFTFDAVHDPCPDNYSHSEIRAFCAGEPHKRDGPKKVKMGYRIHLKNQMLLRRRPSGRLRIP